MAEFKNMVTQINDGRSEYKGAIANYPKGKNLCLLLIADPKIIKEFLMKETQFCFRNAPLGDQNLGIFFDQSHSALSVKPIFTQFFEYEKLQLLNEPIKKIGDRVLEEFITKVWQQNSHEYKLIHMKPILSQFLVYFSNNVNFGVGEGEDLPYIENGQTVTAAISEVCDSEMLTYIKPYNLITNNLFHKLKLSKLSRHIYWLHGQIDACLMKEYNKRKQELINGVQHSRFMNILDQMVSHNVKCEQTGNTEKCLHGRAIVGNIFLFQLAGYQTSLDTMLTGITYIAESQKWMEKCRQSGLKTIEEILNNKPLEYCTREFQRLAPPIPLNVPRLVVKDYEFAGIKVKKGDHITYAQGGLNLSTEYYKNPESFEPERFKDKEWEASLPKQLNIPFGLGKRNCMGKELAFQEVRIYMSRLIDRLDMKLPDNFERKMILEFGYKVENSSVMAKLRTF